MHATSFAGLDLTIKWPDDVSQNDEDMNGSKNYDCDDEWMADLVAQLRVRDPVSEAE